MAKQVEWLSLKAAAQRYGYAHTQSLTRRLRQLRKLGHVADVGEPPAGYNISQDTDQADIVLMWANPQTALLRSDASFNLLKSQRGKPKLSYTNN